MIEGSGGTTAARTCVGGAMAGQSLTGVDVTVSAGRHAVRWRGAVMGSRRFGDAEGAQRF